MFENLDGMSPDVPTVKVRVEILNWSKWILVIDILNHILLTLLTFITLQSLRKVSICCTRLLLDVCYYVNVQFRVIRELE